MRKHDLTRRTVARIDLVNDLLPLEIEEVETRVILEVLGVKRRVLEGQGIIRGRLPAECRPDAAEDGWCAHCGLVSIAIALM
jgi:hypothetical protein